MNDYFTRSTCGLVAVIVTFVVVALAIIIFALSADDENDEQTVVVSATPMAQSITATATRPAITQQPIVAQPIQGQVQATLIPTQAVSNAQVVVATANPACTPRTDWPLYTVVAGDTLSGLAENMGITLTELAQANCLAETTLLLVDQTLYVPSLPTVSLAQQGGGVAAANTTTTGCTEVWFFAFNTNAVAPTTCPGGINTVEAIGQNFENGRVIWYAAPPTTTNQHGIVYVIYNTGTWESYVDTWNSTLPASDPALAAPAGLYQPTEAIGKVWRENQNVRAALGWAVDTPIVFVGRFQNPTSDATQFFIDNGQDNLVLRLAVPNTWQPIGVY
ncbi:MAG: LysM peptidoglycan-binding domain-containing protein [Anaerolineae bacterium]|nr:LysM peptidoglycan-binding domain-containing protein [Anaerolineae bacterium]